MTKEFDSPIFGPTRWPSEEEKQSIEAHVAATPVTVFAAIQRAFNARGLRLVIDVAQAPEQSTPH